MVKFSVDMSSKVTHKHYPYYILMPHTTSQFSYSDTYTDFVYTFTILHVASDDIGVHGTLQELAVKKTVMIKTLSHTHSCFNSTYQWTVHQTIATTASKPCLLVQCVPCHTGNSWSWLWRVGSKANSRGTCSMCMLKLLPSTLLKTEQLYMSCYMW